MGQVPRQRSRRQYRVFDPENGHDQIPERGQFVVGVGVLIDQHRRKAFLTHRVDAHPIGSAPRPPKGGRSARRVGPGRRAASLPGEVARRASVFWLHGRSLPRRSLVTAALRRSHGPAGAGSDLKELLIFPWQWLLEYRYHLELGVLVNQDGTLFDRRRSDPGIGYRQRVMGLDRRSPLQ